MFVYVPEETTTQAPTTVETTTQAPTTQTPTTKKQEETTKAEILKQVKVTGAKNIKKKSVKVT